MRHGGLTIKTTELGTEKRDRVMSTRQPQEARRAVKATKYIYIYIYTHDIQIVFLVHLLICPGAPARLPQSLRPLQARTFRRKRALRMTCAIW